MASEVVQAINSKQLVRTDYVTPLCYSPFSSLESSFLPQPSLLYSILLSILAIFLAFSTFSSLEKKTGVSIILIKNISRVRSYVQVPTMRTQYMRVAFQIPFDATVRVSLDTNLCMISERTKETINGECLPHTIFLTFPYFLESFTYFILSPCL